MKVSKKGMKILSPDGKEIGIIKGGEVNIDKKGNLIATGDFKMWSIKQ